MTHVLVTRGFSKGGGHFAFPGDRLHLPDEDAQALIDRGWAQRVDAEVQTAQSPGPGPAPAESSPAAAATAPAAPATTTTTPAAAPAPPAAPAAGSTPAVGGPPRFTREGRGHGRAPRQEG
jgi:hypothetical protein